jgi:hypothetical protein
MRTMTPTSQPSLTEQLERLAELRNKHALTSTEFAAAKSAILGQPSEPAPAPAPIRPNPPTLTAAVAPLRRPYAGRPGVKPDRTMITEMTQGPNRLTRTDAGLSTHAVALRFYDFKRNSVEAPSTASDVPHKVKLSIGATMKALDWKRRMKHGVWGWYPKNADVFFKDEIDSPNDPHECAAPTAFEPQADSGESVEPLRIDTTPALQDLFNALGGTYREFGRMLGVSHTHIWHHSTARESPSR